MARAGLTRVSHIEILGTVPLVAKITHDESGVELHAPFGESRDIREIAGVNVIDVERLNAPAVRPEFETVEAVRCARHGVANRARLEEGRRLGKRGEAR